MPLRARIPLSTTLHLRHSKSHISGSSLVHSRRLHHWTLRSLRNFAKQEAMLATQRRGGFSQRLRASWFYLVLPHAVSCFPVLHSAAASCYLMLLHAASCFPVLPSAALCFLVRPRATLCCFVQTHSASCCLVRSHWHSKSLFLCNGQRGYSIT